MLALVVFNGCPLDRNLALRIASSKLTPIPIAANSPITSTRIFVAPKNDGNCYLDLWRRELTGSR